MSCIIDLWIRFGLLRNGKLVKSDIYENYDVIDLKLFQIVKGNGIMLLFCDVNFLTCRTAQEYQLLKIGAKTYFLSIPCAIEFLLQTWEICIIIKISIMIC